MPAIISDEPAWAKGYPPAPGFKPPTIRESLATGFDDGAVFYLHDERPIAVWPDRACAVDFSQYPTREVPSEPILSGTKITEWQFRTLVCALHGIVK
jgi:hypothetical protein